MLNVFKDKSSDLWSRQFMVSSNLRLPLRHQFSKMVNVSGHLRTDYLIVVVGVFLMNPFECLFLGEEVVARRTFLSE